MRYEEAYTVQSKFERKIREMKKELKQTNIEHKFLSKKYIAFLIYRSWTKTRA